MKKSILSILSLLVLSVAPKLEAQTFTNYTTLDGLPDNDVLCLAEGNSDDMWFGTEKGIAKYDGVTWTIYNTTTNSELPSNSIKSILVDEDGDVWIGTLLGLSLYDGTSFTTYKTTDGLASNSIVHIAEAPNGDIWLSHNRGATVYDGTTFQNYDNSDGIPFGGVKYIDFDSKGEVYMATPLSGVIQFDGTDFTVYETGLSSTNVTAIAIDKSDNKWVATEEGITVLDDMNAVVAIHETVLIPPPPHTVNPLTDIKVNSKGDVWAGVYLAYLGNEGGVATTSNGGTDWSDYEVNEGLVGPVVKRITIDKEDNVWIATSTGITKMSFPVIDDVGIDQFDLTNNPFSVYPNPANEIINISFNVENKELNNIDFYNASMQLVKQISLNANQQFITVSVNEMAKGMYFIKYGTKVERVVIN